MHDLREAAEGEVELRREAAESETAQLGTSISFSPKPHFFQ